jgi:hypothetical protein
VRKGWGCIPILTKKGIPMRRVLHALTSGAYVLLGVIVALTRATASIDARASEVGSVFKLGVTNTVNAISKLTGSVAGSSLQIINSSTATGATALELQVTPGKPPLKINRTTKVANLNADLLDGSDSTQLAPVLRAQEDATDVGTTVSGTTEVNSVPIEVPVDGVLLISGTAYVNSFEESAIDYILNPKVDGSDATPYGWGAFQNAGVGSPMGNGAPGSRFTLSYTVSQPVGAGSHTVSQELGQYSGVPAEFFYNQNELSVMFVPGSRASVISAPAAAAARDDLSPTGQKR